MANVKAVRIIADVPFDYLNEGYGHLPASEAAVIGSLLLSPSIGLTYRYEDIGYKPNSHGGHTAMYRLFIEGEEALNHRLLVRLCMALKRSGEFAQLHVAEARDLEFSPDEPWEHIVHPRELSGEAVRS